MGIKKSSSRNKLCGWSRAWSGKYCDAWGQYSNAVYCPSSWLNRWWGPAGLRYRLCWAVTTKRWRLENVYPSVVVGHWSTNTCRHLGVWIWGWYARHTAQSILCDNWLCWTCPVSWGERPRSIGRWIGFDSSANASEIYYIPARSFSAHQLCLCRWKLDDSRWERCGVWRW